MSAKRPSIDLAALTSEIAAPMPEAAQRSPLPPPMPLRAVPPAIPKEVPQVTRSTPEIETLAFKVPAEFYKRYKLRAAEAGLKLNGLLFEALDAWEEREGLKK